MKKISILISVLAVLGETFAQAPILPQKDLSVNKVCKGLKLDAADGFQQAFNFNALAIDTTKGYTIEFKAKINSAAGRGLDIEGRDAGRNGFRISTAVDGMSNNSLPASPGAIHDGANNDDYHTFRFAVKSGNVHIYRDEQYISTQSMGYLGKEDVMNAYNPGFENTDMGMWALETGKATRTTAANEFRSGLAALKLSASAQSAIATLTIKELKPNTSYGLSFWAKGIVMGGNMRYQLILGRYDESGAFVQNSLVDWNGIKPTTTDWTMLGRSFTTTDLDKVLMVKFLGWNGNNTLVLDDFALNENETVPVVGAPIGGNLIVNGTFETNADGWPQTDLIWPLKTADWASTKGGQLQVKESPWGNNAEANYNVTVDVTPGRTYKLSATTSHLLATPAGSFRYIRLLDGVAKAEAAYTCPAGLTTYGTYTTPAFTVGNESSTVTMQFSTKVQNSNTPRVVMTLDNVELQEYEALYPSFISFGKLSGRGDADIDIEYFNYNLTGAYAPGVVDPNKALWNLIEIAADRIDKAEIGNIPGKYPQQAYDAYQAEIDYAKGRAQEELTEEQKTEAISRLTAAGITFMNSVFGGEYYPKSVVITAYESKLEQGEATSTSLSITMNDDLEVEYNDIVVKYINLTPEVIDINAFGSIIGKAKGTGKLEVIVSYEEREARDTVDVEVVTFDKMVVNIDSESVLVGDSIVSVMDLTLNDNTPFQTMYYTGFSSNRGVAEFSYDGKIYARGEGTAQITTWVKRGNVEKTDVKIVTVTNPGSGLDPVVGKSSGIYPNPAQNEVYVTNTNSVVIYNLSGQCVMNVAVSGLESATAVNVGSLINGVYLVKLTDVNKTSVFEKLIINR